MLHYQIDKKNEHKTIYIQVNLLSKHETEKATTKKKKNKRKEKNSPTGGMRQ